MPTGTSDFRFLGTVTSDCALEVVNSGLKVANFAIAVRVPFQKKQGRCNFPIKAFGENAEKASVLCRNGARVAITGTIVSEDYVDLQTGEVYVRVFFYASEIIRLTTPKRKSLTDAKKTFSDLTTLSPIPPYPNPKKHG